MIKAYYQGEAGSFSDIAASRFFKGRAKTRGLFDFEKVFDTVRRQQDACGVIPIENTLCGSMHHNYDLLLKSDLSIVGEIKMRISFNLYGLPGTTMKSICEIWSHPVALEQCRTFLSRFHNIKVVPVFDAAGVAKTLIRQKRREVGLIAGFKVGAFYGLRTLRKKIEDSAENYTRFLIVANSNQVCGKHDAKTSLVFGVKNAPGILFRCLGIFALRNIDLVKLESRPFIGKPWEYLFYVDFTGSMEEDKCQKAIEDLKKIAVYTKILGSYDSRQG